MINIKIFVFSPFSENTFVLYDETKECIIIDAGCYGSEEEKSLVEFIEQNQLKPVKLVNTHCHIDHIFGNRYVAEKYGLKLYAHSADAFLIDQAQQHALMFGAQMDDSIPIDKKLDDEKELAFGNSKLEIRHIPGHSPGGVVFYNADQKFVIVGDVLFNNSIGRSDLPGGNHQLLVGGIREKLLTLDDDVIVYPGHGPQTTIGQEKSSNPFLKE